MGSPTTRRGAGSPWAAAPAVVEGPPGGPAEGPGAAEAGGATPAPTEAPAAASGDAAAVGGSGPGSGRPPTGGPTRALSTKLASMACCS
eukprot:13207660-Alexandrium_andersonii.AAC.1